MKTARMSARSRLGFTLVELMVVVAVIGILSAIVYANFGATRAIARDNIRKTDLKDLQVAIELYKAQNGHYPLRGCIDSGDSVGLWSGANPEAVASVEQCANYIEGLVPDYISALPVDPKPTLLNTGYIYRTNSNTDPTEYKLMAWRSVEVKKITGYNDEMARCSKATNPACPATFPPTSPNSPELHNTYAVFKGSAAEGY